MNIEYKKLDSYKELIFLFLYCSILFGFFFNEDTLGGAKPDFLYHYAISEKFDGNFLQNFKMFGSGDMGTRNSPIFWVIIGFLNKIISFDNLRLLNCLSSLFIGIFFYKCLLIKFEDQKKIYLIFLSSIIFLSPTIRSLSIWPYSLIWGLLFFIISIYHFLKIQNNTGTKEQFIIYIKVLSFLILSSYIYPSFGIFYLYFFSHMLFKFKFSKYLIFLLIYSLILSIPAAYYVFENDMISSFNNSQGLSISYSQALNLSNKIMIIATMFLFFVLPVVNFKETFFDFQKINYQVFLMIFLFSIINIYFFNFPYIDGGAWGGGFFHKFSNMFFNNNLVFFTAFILSILIIYSILLKNWNNYLLLILLILFNPQFTIYNKYYDPLIYILFLTLFQLDMKKHFFNKKYKNIQLYSLSASYLALAVFKNYLL